MPGANTRSRTSRAISKDVKYVNRDFDNIKNGLTEFAKVYYPNTYNDFNEASPGMMFLEMAAYVGDVLNYYIDSQFKETMLLHATEKRSVQSLAAAIGYKPKLSVPATVDLDVFQLLPASNNIPNTTSTPNLSYAIKLAIGTQVRSTVGGITFIIQNVVDFSINSQFDPTTISVFSYDSTGLPNYYLAKKSVRAISAMPKTQQEIVGNATKYYKILVRDTNLIAIDSIVDSDGNTWYEVPYLAQDTIFENVTNTALNDPDAAVYSADVPYLLKLKRVPRRFITRVVGDDLEIQFGSGVSNQPDEELIATPENVGLALPNGKDDIDFSIDPAAPVFTGTYGISPSNTTLTITYLVGGGISANVPSNTITDIIGADTSNTTMPTSTTVLNTTILGSLAVNNPTAAGGGRSGEMVEEVRQNALAQLGTQNRAVTREDYIIRAYAMPNIFGSVAKVFITPDEQNNITDPSPQNKVANPLAMNMYMLGYDNNKNLTSVNRAVKENLKTYISQYRMLTDSINFMDAYIINISVDFEIIPLPNYNVNEVLLRAIDSIKDFFNIDNWQVNEPIVMTDIISRLISTEGVQTAKNVRIANMSDTTLGYSAILYNIVEATRSGVVYPSLDPAIFEVKFPNADIKGRIVTY